MTTLPARYLAQLLGAERFITPVGGQPPPQGLPWEVTYLREPYGMAPWVIDVTTTYQHAWWVDFLNGDDGNTGTTANAPFKTFFAAWSAWDAAGAPGSSVIWMAGVQHKEYFSHSNAGFGSADVDTVTNLAFAPTSHGLNAFSELHVRTKLSDVLVGKYCEWEGSGIPKSYGGIRTNAHEPSQLCLPVSYIRVQDMRFTNSAGNAVRWGIKADLRGTGLEQDRNYIRNVHISHAHGDGCFSPRGNTVTWATNCLVHHCQSWYAAGGGNTTSGLKFPSNVGGGIRGCVLFKNADDNTDFLDADAMTLANNACWLAGYFWFDVGSSVGETSTSWTPYDETYRLDSTGNGNGYKLGGQGTSFLTVAYGNMSHNNKTTGFTDNSGEGYVLYNNTSLSNGTIGYRLGGKCWVANNVSGLNGNIDVNDSPRSGATGPAYQRRNSWSDSAASTRTGNFNIAVGTSDFVQYTGGQSGMLQAAPGGLLIGVEGFSTPTECRGVTGWENQTLSFIKAQIGAR